MADTADRVKETSTTEGTGTYDLAGAATGFQTFVAGIGDGNTCYYCATDGSSWEVGIGTVTDAATDTLSRDRILASSNADAAVNWGAGTKTIFVTAPAATSGRERLTANRTYYVRTDGSDSNDGLANTAGGAWLTIQKAIDEVAKLDISIYDVTIQLGNGTYTLSAGVVIKFPLGAGTITLLGDTTTPSNVVITNTALAAGSNMISCKQPSAVTFYIKGVKITSSSAGTYIGGFHAVSNGRLELQNIDFGAWSSGANGRHINCETQGYIGITGNYTISGGCAWHMLVFNGYINNGGTRTITLSGTPVFTRFAYATGLGYIRANGHTYSGSATGQRYYADEGSIVYSGGGGANYFPGDSAGATATGGQYI